jgi:hypothetical protein
MDEETLASNSLSLRCFRDSNGEQAARNWLESIHWKDRKIIGGDIKTVQKNWPIGLPLVVALSDEVWEVRSKLADGFARVVFLVKDNEMILIRGHISRTKADEKEEVLDIDLHHKLDVAAKAFYVYQAEVERKKQKLSKAELSRRMKTSRRALDRLLDPKTPSTLKSLNNLARALGKQLQLELI